MSTEHLSTTRFAEFSLPASVQAGITAAGFEFCTPIQAATLPLALRGQDLAGQAQTGTGKTAAFLVAMFARLETGKPERNRRASQPRALILAPTRELAIQIHKDAETLKSATGYSLGLVYGGVDYEKQRKQLQAGVDILIGTPGRLIDYHKQRLFDLRAVEVMVLDEADRMFDLGFIKDLRFILRRCSPPEKRLSMLFSATLSYRVMELAYEHMNNPEKVEIQTEQVTTDRVKQSVFYPANEEKIPLLVGLIQKLQPERSIVFTNTKHAAEKISAWLAANGISAALLSGDVPQKKRQKLLEAFQTGQYQALVATDVAARGLHIPHVTHVFNYDLPQLAEDYVHRIGRTARAGESGVAISFACEDTSFYLPEIEAYIQQKIPLEQVDEYKQTDLKYPKKTRKKKLQPGHNHKPSSRGRTKRGGRNSNKTRQSLKSKSSHSRSEVKQNSDAES